MPAQKRKPERLRKAEMIILGIESASLTASAAIVADARAVRREERGSLVLLILVCLTLVSFALLFWLTVKPLS